MILPHPLLNRPTSLNSPQAVRFPLNDYEPDSVQILKFLEATRAGYSNVPLIREKTVSLLRGARDNDLVDQVNRVVTFVKRNVTYVRDPVNAEYIVSPVRMLEMLADQGFVTGDCDDHAMLLNSMLGSIGFNTKFIAVKLNGSSRFNHVISGIQIGGKLVPIDPCHKSNKQQPVYGETLTV